jgi:uncharacterized lipoprotein YddW (UPF0748 family)
MIIFKNGFICLFYEPATDILSFEMPNVDSVVMPEMERSLNIIVEHTRNYDVKRILLDAKNTDIWVEEKEYACIIAAFYRNLAATRVQRIARIVKPASKREHIVKKVLDAAMLPIQVQRFIDEVSAREWLLDAEYPV